MILLIPSSKTLDFETAPWKGLATEPCFLSEAQALVKALQDLTPAALSSLLALSPKLTEATVAKYAAWRLPLEATRARPAMLAYAGDLYEGLAAHNLKAGDLAYAQERLRILSGLYGVLRPLDLILPYRLEMGARLVTPGAKDLKAFWRKRLTTHLTGLLREESTQGRPGVLVNLASEEFAKAVDFKQLPGRVITPVFQEGKGGNFKVVSFFAKRARGMMARYVLQHRLDVPEALLGFAEDGYRFDAEASSGDRWLFRREAA